MTSLSERAYAAAGAAADFRADGRRRGEYRACGLELGVLPSAAGSAQLRLGGTTVLAAVLAQPESHARPGAGRLVVAVEVVCAPSSGGRERAAADLLEAALQASLEACLRGCLDAAGLAVAPRCSWAVTLQVCVLSRAGSLLDAASLAAAAALRDARLPFTRPLGGDGGGGAAGGGGDGGGEEWELAAGGLLGPLPLRPGGPPLAVTLTRLGDAAVVDADEGEEACAAVAGGGVWAAFGRGGSLVASGAASQSGGAAAPAASAPPSARLAAELEDAARAAAALHRALDAAMEAAQAARPPYAVVAWA